MNSIPEEILKYLDTQRVGVLAVEMLDGAPHASTVHFANSTSPLIFYFETTNTYRKAEPILKNKKTRASLVIGIREDEMKTFQLDGMVSLIKPEETSEYNKVYFSKFKEKVEKAKDSRFLSFKFVPSWWRFTDWTKPAGQRILLSE